ncbi:hypothetical protein NIES4103_04600 [Nostoc sp. NIES-4103]|nr:hypothetical protein NIES4103_04600 [Nostoc sp. NIES-4103]
MGHWALGMGHGAWGMGHGELGMVISYFSLTPSSPSSPNLRISTYPHIPRGWINLTMLIKLKILIQYYAFN